MRLLPRVPWEPYPAWSRETLLTSWLCEKPMASRYVLSLLSQIVHRLLSAEINLSMGVPTMEHQRLSLISSAKDVSHISRQQKLFTDVSAALTSLCEEAQKAVSPNLVLNKGLSTTASGLLFADIALFTGARKASGIQPGRQGGASGYSQSPETDDRRAPGFSNPAAQRVEVAQSGEPAGICPGL